MKKILFSTMTLAEADGATGSFDLEYYILEDQTNGEGINISTFGIEVVKIQKIDGITYTEAKTVHEICAAEKTVHQIAKTLSDNTVTPICLEEIINDIMSASEFHQKNPCATGDKSEIYDIIAKEMTQKDVCKCSEAASRV